MVATAASAPREATALTPASKPADSKRRPRKRPLSPEGAKPLADLTANPMIHATHAWTPTRQPAQNPIPVAKLRPQDVKPGSRRHADFMDNEECWLPTRLCSDECLNEFWPGEQREQPTTPSWWAPPFKPRLRRRVQSRSAGRGAGLQRRAPRGRTAYPLRRPQAAARTLRPRLSDGL